MGLRGAGSRVEGSRDGGLRVEGSQDRGCVFFLILDLSMQTQVS
jgi:hypothetical protein